MARSAVLLNSSHLKSLALAFTSAVDWSMRLMQATFHSEIMRGSHVVQRCPTRKKEAHAVEPARGRQLCAKASIPSLFCPQ